MLWVKAPDYVKCVCNPGHLIAVSTAGALRRKTPLDSQTLVGNLGSELRRPLLAGWMAGGVKCRFICLRYQSESEALIALRWACFIVVDCATAAPMTVPHIEMLPRKVARCKLFQKCTLINFLINAEQNRLAINEFFHRWRCLRRRLCLML